MSQSVQYMVRDAQGQEYGPADIPTLRQWVLERRILAGMQIAPAGSQQWTVAGLHPQLADLFRRAAAGAGSAAGQPQPPGVSGGYAPVAQNYGPGAFPSGDRGLQTNSMAVASLICSLLGILGVCAPVSVLGVIFGHVARAQIRGAPGQYEGEGLALAGLIIGYVCTALWVGVVLLFILFAATAQAHH